MPKKVAPQDRKNAPLLTTVTLKIRDQVESLAHKERVSVAEISRRAVTQYLKEKAG